jgi:hypothetical protein
MVAKRSTPSEHGSEGDLDPSPMLIHSSNNRLAALRRPLCETPPSHPRNLRLAEFGPISHVPTRRSRLKNSGADHPEFHDLSPRRAP